MTRNHAPHREPVKPCWRRPQLTRYLLPAAEIAMYQIASGPVVSFQCTNPDQCEAGEGASLPPWLIPG